MLRYVDIYGDALAQVPERIKQSFRAAVVLGTNDANVLREGFVGFGGLALEDTGADAWKLCGS